LFTFALVYLVVWFANFYLEIESITNTLGTFENVFTKELYVHFVHFAVFQRKVFEALANNAFRMKRLAKDVLVIKHILQKQNPAQNTTTSSANTGSHTEVIVLIQLFVIFSCLLSLVDSLIQGP